MKSIAEIFDNSKELLDSITENTAYEYADNPLMRLVDPVKESKFPVKCVNARKLLTDKILAGFTVAGPYRMFVTGSFFRNYKKDTFYRFDLLEKANWEGSSWKWPAMWSETLSRKPTRSINAHLLLMTRCMPVPVGKEPTFAAGCLVIMATRCALDTG